MDNPDVLVIGAGPGGYVAAIRCAQLGLKTACVDAWVTDKGKPVLGGTCLNVGCIPSKALLDSSHHYDHIRNHVAPHGIKVAEVSCDLAKMMGRKDKIVRTLTQGIVGLFKKHQVQWLQGEARLIGDRQVEISPTGKQPAEKTTLSPKHIIVATGSVPMNIPQAPVDDQVIFDSSGALAFDQVPKRLGVIGAGVIGLELGSVWRRLGAEVVVLEALDEFLPSVDGDIAQVALNTLASQGLEIRLGCRVTGTKTVEAGVEVQYEHQGETQAETFDKLVVAVGRRPTTDNLNIEAASLELDARGFIQVDEFCRTSIPTLYAIGDVVRGPMLAHKASEEGMAVAEHIAGQAAMVEHRTIPWVIYTWPEIAWVGQTEQELSAQGVDYRIGTFPFMASGRARAMAETDGMVKCLAAADSDRILGVHIIGANASELIAEAVLSMEFEGSSEDLARTIHAHPTLSEALHEAALAVDDRTIHI